MVTVGPGCSSVTVTVGPGRGTLTVTVGPGTITLTVTVGPGFTSCLGPLAPTTPCTKITAINASPVAAAIASAPLDQSRFRSFLRCLLLGRGPCGVITPPMVDPATARAAAVPNNAGLGSYGY
jgi:hypothetical protein